jgi:hypothetical protein
VNQGPSQALRCHMYQLSFWTEHCPAKPYPSTSPRESERRWSFSTACVVVPHLLVATFSLHHLSVHDLIFVSSTYPDELRCEVSVYPFGSFKSKR